jgi:quercetin dioxygenase-like cupin family protein
MIIKEVLSKLNVSAHPVAMALHKGKDFKALIIGMKKGMLLKEHKAAIPSKLTVLTGVVIYREADREVRMSQHDTLDIPIEKSHQVEAEEDTICLLTQG